MLPRDYRPSVDKLLLFLGGSGSRLASDPLFRGCHLTRRSARRPSRSAPGGLGQICDDEKAEDNAVQWIIQHVVFRTATRYFTAPRSLLDRDIVQLVYWLGIHRVLSRFVV